MGAWGDTAFEDDDGLDCAADLAEGLTTLQETFAVVNDLQPDAYLHAPEAARALAAAEVVAAMLDRPLLYIPASVESFLATTPSLDDELRRAAERAVVRVFENSELAELRLGQEEWADAVADLQTRISDGSS